MKKIETSEPEKFINADIYPLKNGLQILAECEISNFELAYAISRNLVKLKTAIEAYDKCFSALLEKYQAVKDDKGKWVIENNTYMFPGEKERSSFIKDRTELDEQPLTIVFHSLKASSLSTIESLKPIYLVFVEKLISHDQD